jgi:hypothetical protein
LQLNAHPRSRHGNSTGTLVARQLQNLKVLEAQRKEATMKTRKDHKFVIRVVGAWWLSNVVAPAKALHYGRAAQRDERSGFPYTAAVEWRNAAELVAFNPRAAEYCWRQWERIMHLPRQLAGPVSVSRIVVFPGKSASATPPAMERTMEQVSLPTTGMRGEFALVPRAPDISFGNAA